ncbi:MAG: Dabb family protein [Clostridia bacterium]|nr:Dabb family protein [Clostridia bacterium]
MIKHVIIWSFKKDVRDKEGRKREIKERLEDLVGKIRGLKEMKVVIDPLPSSNGDLMLDSTFENEAALATYQKHFLHLEIVNTLVCPAVEVRLCMDYEI